MLRAKISLVFVCVRNILWTIATFSQAIQIRKGGESQPPRAQQITRHDSAKIENPVSINVILDCDDVRVHGHVSTNVDDYTNEWMRIYTTCLHIEVQLGQESFLRMMRRRIRWHCTPDTGFKFFWSAFSLTSSTTASQWKLFRFDKMDINEFDILLTDVTFNTYVFKTRCVMC